MLSAQSPSMERLLLETARLTVSREKKDREGNRILEDLQFYLKYTLSELHRHALLTGNPRYADPKRLIPYGYKVYSQNDEDGILHEIFQRIGMQDRLFVEFGVEKGLENNSLHLLMQGWNGVWIEGDPEFVRAIEEMFVPLIGRGQLRVKNAFLRAESIERIFTELGIPETFDLLNIEKDGNDYWVWKALARYHPRAVVIKYNSRFGPHARTVMPYKSGFAWKETACWGASLKSYELLGAQKGYKLVGCNLTGTNAFFVREDLVGYSFPEPFTSENHFEPPRLILFPRRDPIDFGELLKV